MPCKRCRHLRKQCTFGNGPATGGKRAPDPTGPFKDFMERLRCMTLILRHHLPHLSLDTESLRRTADALPAQNARPDQNDTTLELVEPPEDRQPIESPSIEDEDCTIDSVDDTTVRTCSASPSKSCTDTLARSL